jgi:hypothetical protein
VIIDVDSHFEPEIAGPNEHPLRAFADQLPSLVDTTIEAGCGNLWNATPNEMRESLAAGMPLPRPFEGRAKSASPRVGRTGAH